jgi:hypothetical protein
MVLAGLPGSHAHAQGTAIGFQGMLDSAGAPVTGLYDMRFSLYDLASGGGLVSGPVIADGVGVTNGLFSLPIDFGPGVFTGPARWLEILVRTNGGASFTALAPRRPLLPAPYAIFAATAGAVPNNSVTANQLQAANTPTSGQILSFDGSSLLWQSPAGASGAWALAGNTAAPGNFLGTVNNQALDFRVNNTRALRIEPGATSPNFVAGYFNNVADSGVVGATISGGGANNLFGLNSQNRVADDFGTVGGGAENLAGDGTGNFEDAYFATVGGGHANVAAGIAATIAGGSHNRATNESSTIGGGYLNQASGGRSTVAGGYLNRATALYATVAGGQANTAAAPYAGINGGLNNTASGSGATVGGGVANLASGANAVIPGGNNNAASGPGSFAAGSTAQAVHPGSFVWADSQSTPPPLPQGIPFSSIANDEFAIRARGGVRLNTDTSLWFGSQTRQMINLWGPSYGIGVQYGNAYFRANVGAGFAWHVGGVHDDNTYNPGGGTTLMTLDGSAGLMVYQSASVCTLTIRGGCDLAEPFPMDSDDLPKGSVVVIDESRPGALKLSRHAYDTRVAGVISGANGVNPGISLHQEGALDSGQNVALSGRVYVQTDATYGAIHPGDLLTTSDTPGHAMRASDHTRAQGAILGKAMSPLPSGRGTVLVLVTLQ